MPWLHQHVAHGEVRDTDSSVDTVIVHELKGPAHRCHDRRQQPFIAGRVLQLEGDALHALFLGRGQHFQQLRHLARFHDVVTRSGQAGTFAQVRKNGFQ